jgi:uncharacterized protein YukE
MERMSTSPQAQALRTRAQQLRHTASRIDASSALTVNRLAGPETWIGPAAQACLDFLVTLRRQVETSSETLRDAARRLEQRADEIDLRQSIAANVS